MTVQQLLNTAQQHLSTVSDSPVLDAQMLLASTIQLNTTQLYTWPDKTVTAAEQQYFQHLLDRRLQGEPIAYILGEKEFFSLNFTVTQDTLIPRPETELLVELILKHIANDSKKQILDLGTGCGAIALAIAKQRPHWTVLATDKSKPALNMAKHNTQRLMLNNVELLHSDWFKHLPKKQFHAIVSNPPYIATGDEHLRALSFEPDSALTSGKQGLDDLSHIISHASEYLLPGGLLCLEHGYQQQTVVKQLLQQAGFHTIQNYQDLSQQPRAVIALHPTASSLPSSAAFR